MTSIRIPVERQGQPGMGQGGWTCFEFVRAIGRQATVALRNPIPLDTDLEVRQARPDHWLLVDPRDPDTTILEATPWQPDCPDTAPVTVDEATAARELFPFTLEDHPAPNCASCGLGERSLRAHAGPLGDGRWATPFRLPEWSATSNGAVGIGLLWMAMDCTAAWYASMEGSAGGHRQALTVQFAVDVTGPIEPETDYALVAWNGDYPPHWDGRKRGAASALFDARGTCIARSRSFWVATP